MRRITKPVLLVTYGLILYFFLLRFSDFSSMLGGFLNLIKPFIWGFALAYLLNIPYEYFLLKGFKSNKTHPSYKLHKLLSLVISYALFFLVFTFIFSMLIPQITESATIFADNSQSYYESLQEFFNDIISKLKLQVSLWEEIQNAVLSLIQQLRAILPSLFTFITSTASSVLDLVFTLFISMYILASKDSLLELASKSVKAFASPKLQGTLEHILTITNATFRGFIVGQLLDAVIIGIITFIGSSIFGFPYPVLLGFLAGVTNVIPVIGPFIGAVPCVLIILMAYPEKALWYIIFITILQQVDGNFICPKVVGDSTGLDGLWILFAVMVGGGLFGIVGCLLSVPIFAILYKLYNEFLNHRLTLAPTEADTSPQEIDSSEN